jgi:hypothetical protein
MNWSYDGTSRPISKFKIVGAGRVEISRGRVQLGRCCARIKLSLIVPEETVWQTATEVTEPNSAFARLWRVTACAAGAMPRAVVLPRKRRLFCCRGWRNPAARVNPDWPAWRSGVQVYELDYHDESHGFFFALGDVAWSFGPWSSDARVLYCHIEKEKLAHLVVIGGTHVAWQEQPLLKPLGQP